MSAVGMKTVAAAKVEARGGRFHGVGASRAAERSRCGADAEFEGAWHLPRFMQAEQDAGGEGVARAGRAGDLGNRDAHRGLPADFSCARAGADALGKMHDRPCAYAQRDQGAGGVFDGGAI